MKKIVVKFGGSNLKTKEDIAKLIRATSYYKVPIVIVVSALFGVTDILVQALEKVRTNEAEIDALKIQLIDAHVRLIDFYINNHNRRVEVSQRIRERVDELEKYLRGIHYLGEIPDFVKDRVLSYGERLSALTLTAVLDAREIKCEECLPESLGLVTDGEYGNASVDFVLSELVVRDALSRDHIYIVPGFYGISSQSKVTLFGRGGSDYTAAALARCIDAESVDIWKDVPGFMSADPKMVDDAVSIDRLTYAEAAELSYFGARILHPRTFEPVINKRIPIRIFNIDDFSHPLVPVTIIGDREEYVADVVKSVTFSDDFGILRLTGPGVGIKPGVIARVAGRLSDEGINIKSIVTAQTCINIMLSREESKRGLRVVKELDLSVLDDIECMEDVSIIAVVGCGMLETPGIAARVFGAVSMQGINVLIISTGASGVATYFVVDRQERSKAMQSIHREFFSR